MVEAEQNASISLLKILPSQHSRLLLLLCLLGLEPCLPGLDIGLVQVLPRTPICFRDGCCVCLAFWLFAISPFVVCFGFRGRCALDMALFAIVIILSGPIGIMFVFCVY